MHAVAEVENRQLAEREQLASFMGAAAAQVAALAGLAGGAPRARAV